MRLGATVRTLTAGDVRSRMAAFRQGNQAVTVAVTGAALRTGALEALARRPSTTEDLAGQLGWTGVGVAGAFLRTLAAYDLVVDRDGVWQVTRRGRRVLGDDVVRAAYEAFSGYHTGLYRDLDAQLSGGPGRRDIEDEGRLVARLSHVMDQFVLAELDRVVDAADPTRVLDVGCGGAAHLVHLLGRAPGSTGVGVETDPEAAAMARAAVGQAGLARRADVVEADVADYLRSRPDERFDLVLLANVVYYVPFDERTELFRTLAQQLLPGGRLLVVTTARTTERFSRHFDLLLRAQTGERELPDMEQLAGQVRAAGLLADRPRRIAVGEPLTSLVARSPA